MKLISSLLAFCSSLETGPGGPGGLAGPGLAFGLQPLVDLSAFDFDSDGKARPKPGWSAGKGNKPTQKPLKPGQKKPTKPTQRPQQRPTRRPIRPTKQTSGQHKEILGGLNQYNGGSNQYQPTKKPYLTTKKPYIKPTTRKPYVKPTRKPYVKPTRKPYVKPTKKPYVKPTTKKPYVKPTTKKPYVKPTTKKPYYAATTKKPYYAPTTKKPYYTTTKKTTKYTTTTPKDVNECYLGTDECHYNAKCINTYGAYDCICNTGYSGNGKSCQPKDVDECSNGSHYCHAYAACTNTVGSYTCTCNSGYEGTGFSCTEEEVNECVTGAHNCSPYADCIDKSWGFKCRCKSGYEGDGVSCVAKSTDPCDGNICAASATCTPGMYGGYTCACPTGYSGTGMGNNGCNDIDECYNGAHTCVSTSATCLNTAGSYNCACQEGYSGNGYDCDLDDVDECYLGTDFCASNAICTNTETGYDCTCPTGWSGDGLTCYEDAPAVVTCSEYNACSGGATCMNTSNGPECLCGPGYVGNGRLFETTDEHKARPDWASTYETGSGGVNSGSSGSSYTGSSSSGSSSSGSTYSGPSEPSTGDSTYSGPSEPSTGGSTYSGPSEPSSGGSTYSGPSEPSTGGSTYSGPSEPSTGGSTYSGPSDAGTGCVDVDECAGCGVGGSYTSCPCSDPTPVCSNTDGGYTCGIDTAFGDPHFRVTSPGQIPVCFDVDTPSGAIIDLFSDAQTSLEINAQFKNVHNGKKQFIKAIGFTSRKGLQVAVTPTTVEVYENGKEFITYNISSDHVDERMFDVRMVVKPADHETHHNRHTVDIYQDDGEKFRFAVKPGAGSLSFDLEGTHGIKSPTGIIGQFINPGSYTIDEANNIETGYVHIPSKDRAWHAEHQCHQIGPAHVEAFLGRAIRDYQVNNLFGSLFYRAPVAPVATLEEDDTPK